MRKIGQVFFEGIRKQKAKELPEKKTAIEQYNAYGKMGLLIFCQGNGYTFSEYLDVLEFCEGASVLSIKTEVK